MNVYNYRERLISELSYRPEENYLALPDSYSIRTLRGAVAYEKLPSLSNSFDSTPCKELHEYIHQLIFLNSILPCYRDINLEREFSLVIKGLVHKDGMGDYMQMRLVAQKIQKAYPLWKIDIVLEIEELSKRRSKFPIGDPHIHIYGIESPGRLTWESAEDEAAYRLAKTIVESANIVLDLPSMDFPCQIFRSNTIRIIEYGAKRQTFANWPEMPRRLMNLQGGWFQICMGLSPFQSGLIFPDPLPLEDRSLTLLNPALQNLLIENNSTLFFGYARNGYNFFISCCAGSKYLPNPDIDILSTLDYIPSGDVMLDFYKTQGIKSIEYYKKNGEGNYIIENRLDISDEGKSLRLIQPFPLSNNDMRILMANAFCTGCTGDASLSEAFENLFYYEMVARHKQPFFEDLIRLAEELFLSDEPLFINYLKATKAIAETADTHPLALAEEIGDLMTHPKVREQSREFYNFLNQHYNFSSMLIDLVAREALFTEHPSLRAQERDLEESFANGQMSLSQCQEQLYSFLNPMKIR